MSTSMSDLMLQAHFNQLKDQLNASLKTDKVKDVSDEEYVLRRTFNYLKAKSLESKLDEEGHKLYRKVAEVLDKLRNTEINLPDKLPMQKASNNTKKQRKTGS